MVSNRVNFPRSSRVPLSADLGVLCPEDEVLPGDRLRVAAAVGDRARHGRAPGAAASLGVAEGVEALQKRARVVVRLVTNHSNR